MDTGTRQDLELIPSDVVAKILLQLSPQDICSLSLSCTALKHLAYDEQRVWRQLCEQCFGGVTSISGWLQCMGYQPRYRELYPVLVNHAAYVGIWHEAAPSSPQGALFSFRWAADGVQVVQLLPTKRYLTEIMQKPLCALGPAYSRYSAVVVDGTKCVLRDHGSNHAGTVAPCAVAEAAASVAVFGPSGRRSSSGSSSSSSSGSCQDVSEGSSPSSSAGFCSELLRFMQSSVQKTRSGRRNRRAGSEVPPVIYHFTRVVGPLCAPVSKSHPHQLAGLYKGLYGPHGCEMLSVGYDFSGRSAQIVARKLTGDANVPAGQLTWRAAAAALPTPWPAEEQAMVYLRLAMVAATTESAAHLAEVEAEEQAAGNVIAALMQQDDPEGLLPQLEEHVQDQQQQQQGNALAGDAAAAQHDAGMLAGGIAGFAMQQARASVARIRTWAAEMQARKVVAIHKGQGQIANRGFKDPSWVEGRLWVYEDGSCGFVFMVRRHVYHLIDLERLDSDL